MLGFGRVSQTPLFLWLESVRRCLLFPLFGCRPGTQAAMQLTPSADINSPQFAWCPGPGQSATSEACQFRRKRRQTWRGIIKVGILPGSEQPVMLVVVRPPLFAQLAIVHWIPLLCCFLWKIEARLNLAILKYPYKFNNGYTDSLPMCQ